MLVKCCSFLAENGNDQCVLSVCEPTDTRDNCFPMIPHLCSLCYKNNAFPVCVGNRFARPVLHHLFIPPWENQVRRGRVLQERTRNI